jgi:hypothetical protein
VLKFRFEFSMFGDFGGNLEREKKGKTKENKSS